MFFFDSSLKIFLTNFRNFYILLKTIRPANGKNIGKSLVAFSRKFRLKIVKFQILSILWLGDFSQQFSTANLTNFQ